MARTRTGSTIISAILAVIVLLLFGYLLWSDTPPNRSDHLVDPPIEVIEPELPLEIIEHTREVPDSESLRQQQAEAFVDRLAESDSATVVVKEYDDMFVRPDSIIALPELEHRVTTLQRLMQDESLSDDTPLTLRYTEEIRKSTTLNQLKTEEEDHLAPITIETEQGQTITAPLVELLERKDIDKEASVTQIRQQQQVKQIKAGDLANADIPPEQELSVTISHGVQKINIADLIDSDAAEMQDSLFYLHRVTEEDIQGVWGIIQTGLVNNFRQGIQLEREGNENNVRVVIPADADEPLPTGLSSFLGKILHQKVSTSYVYNFNTHTMGYDPNLIKPGQELLLIRFSGDELRKIYHFFAEQSQNDTQSFAIGH